MSPHVSRAIATQLSILPNDVFRLSEGLVGQTCVDSVGYNMAVVAQHACLRGRWRPTGRSDQVDAEAVAQEAQPHQQPLTAARRRQSCEVGRAAARRSGLCTPTATTRAGGPPRSLGLDLAPASCLFPATCKTLRSNRPNCPASLLPAEIFGAPISTLSRPPARAAGPREPAAAARRRPHARRALSRPACRAAAARARR